MMVLSFSPIFLLADCSLIIVLGFSTGSNYSNGDWSNLKPVLRKDPNLVYMLEPESMEEEEEYQWRDFARDMCRPTSSEAVILMEVPVGQS